MRREVLRWLQDVASPRCLCGQPVVRAESRWHLDEDGVWRQVMSLVCRGGCRNVVEPLP